MSKLLDKLEKASRGTVQPLGFGGAARREKVAPMLLLGAAQAGNEAEAKLALEAGLDGAIVLARNGAKSADAAKSAKAFGEAVFGIWYEEAQSEVVEGCDFQVFSSDRSPVAAFSGEERTTVMHVVPELDDGLLRTIDQLPVDAFLVSLADADSLTVAQLMRLARVRGVTSRWLLVHLASLPGKEEMEQLRDGGANAIVVDLTGQTTDALKGCLASLSDLPRETSDRRKGRSYATVPAVNDARPARRPEPEPDEDDWDDDQ